MESKFGSKVHIMDHPLVAHKLTIMRDKNTSVKDFRELVSEIGMLITYEATRDLPLTTKHIETPICEMDAPTLAGRKFVVVPILRAGLGLVDGVLRMVPSARVGHIGMFRDKVETEVSGGVAVKHSVSAEISDMLGMVKGGGHEQA